METKILEAIRNNKCQRKGCLSAGQDNLDVVWYGQKFLDREITCSSCVLKNDEVLRRLEPVSTNLMPLSGFVHEFFKESTQYFKLKSTKEWVPKLTQARKKDLLSGLDSFQKRLTETLKDLVEALKEFTKKIAAKSAIIFTSTEFEQILKMEKQNNFGKLLSQIEVLLHTINRIGKNSFRFYSQSDRNAKNAKLKLTISDVTSRVSTVLSNLSTRIRDKAEQIRKI